MEVAEMLRQAPIFSDLSKRDIKRLAQTARVRSYKAGSVIIKEGGEGFGLFIIASGKAEVVKDADGANPSVLATLGKGDFFGETALMERQPRNATVREAERAEETSRGGRAELKHVKEHEAELEAELASRTQTLEVLDQGLRRLGDEDIEAGVAAAIRMRRAGEQATEIRNELEQSHPNLEALMARLAEMDDDEGGRAGDDMLAEARIAVEELSDHIETLAGRVQDLENTYERAAERTTADQIDGEVDALENEVRRLEREHDRKIVLAHAIREADRRFREEHQPDVVRRGSGYLATITADRYDRLRT